MNTFSPQEAAAIAVGVYNVEKQTVNQAYQNNAVLGCEGMFKVADDTRFVGKTGGINITD